MPVTLRSRLASGAAAAALVISAATGAVPAAAGPEISIGESPHAGIGGVPFTLVASVGGDIGPDSHTYVWTPGDRCELLSQNGPEVRVLCEYVPVQDLDGPARVFAVQVFDGSTLLGSAQYRLQVMGNEITTGHDNPDEDLLLRGRLDSFTADGREDRSVRDVEIEARWFGTETWEHLATVQTDSRGRFTYRLYPLDRALDLRARFGDASETVEGITVRTEPRVRYNRREGTALVTVETVHGTPVVGFRTRLFQYRWVVGEPRSTYLKTLGVRTTNVRGEVTFKVPRWKHSTEYWTGLIENPEYNNVSRCFRIVAPAGCG